VSRTLPASADAARALALAESLQARLVGALESASAAAGAPCRLRPVEWLRDGGVHGGGQRFEVEGAGVFDRASVNVSQVHYDDRPEKRLGSATALSAIVHPGTRAPPRCTPT
jgi:coproporphyrinogen III oxidase